VTSVATGDGCNGRTYAKIKADAIATANDSSSKITLQFKLSKIQTRAEDGTSVIPRSLSQDQFGDFLFEELGIDLKNCLELDTTGRWDTKELVLKAGTRVQHLLTTDQPRTYLQHEILVNQIVKNTTKVTFKTVHPDVPNEEIIQICMAYGEVIDNKVYRENMRIGTVHKRSVQGTTRSVDMRLQEGKFLRNFYWLEGPLHGAQGRRCTVLHRNQPQQCSNCFRYAMSVTKAGSLPCPAAGNGRTCEDMKEPRAKMSSYTMYLKEKDNYVSLKDLDRELQEKLLRRGQHSSSLDQTLQQQVDKQDADAAEHSEEEIMLQEDILPRSPLQMRELEVLQLTSTVENLKEQVTKAEETKKESIGALDRQRMQLQKMLRYNQATQARRMATLFTTSESWESDDAAHVIASYVSGLHPEDFDRSSEPIKPKNVEFMSDVEKLCNPTDEQQEQVTALRERVLLAASKLFQSGDCRLSVGGGRARRPGRSHSNKRNFEEGAGDGSPSRSGSRPRLDPSQQGDLSTIQ
jgi:hypothetical protein